MVDAQVGVDAGEVAAQPGGVEAHGLQRLLHGALGAGRRVRAEELLDVRRRRLRCEVLRRQLHQARQQEPTLDVLLTEIVTFAF